MIETPNISPELLARAFRSRGGGGEFAWLPEDAHEAVQALAAAGYAILGGEAWLVQPNGRVTGLIKVAPDEPLWFFSWSVSGGAIGHSSWQRGLESWEEFCRRAATYSLEVIVGDGTDGSGMKRFREDVRQLRSNLAQTLWCNITFVSREEYEQLPSTSTILSP